MTTPASGPVVFAYDGSELAKLAIEEAGRLLTDGRDALVACVWQPYDVGFAPAGYRSFRQALPVWIKQKLHLGREMDRGLRGRYRGRFVYTDHHESHAASAFFPSPFDEAAINRGAGPVLHAGKK